MAEFIDNVIEPYFNYWVYVILMMIGLWALIAKNNLIKKLIGLSIFQTAIILFYVSLGVKEDATIPILEPYAKQADYGDSTEAPYEKATYPSPTSPDPDTMANPLPHVLMLTAIVVGVATLGVALAISQIIFTEFKTLEEDEILEELKSGSTDG